jgi:hypothetical protein
VNHPTPAIVAQSAVRPLPRWALLLLCVAYVAPGFVGREPWRNVDMAAFGYMHEMALGRSAWLHPLLAGTPPYTDGPLPLWLGAWAIEALGGWLPPDAAARLPFAALLAVTLAAAWHGVYHLALRPGAQPVAFAFGGEAQPEDYARAMADAGLLAFIACLGLAQLSHETSHQVPQLACTALLFFAAAAMPGRMGWPVACAAVALPGLALSGAPSLAALLGLGSAWLVWRERGAAAPRAAVAAAALLGLTLLAAALAWGLDLWSWRIVGDKDAREWENLPRLFIWFCWPAWPLALWTLWRWRHQIASGEWHKHLLLPLWFALVTSLATVLTAQTDRTLLLGLPAFAALAAFALPTLRRSIAALIDWFTLLFFSISAIAIWVVWLAVQTGVPAKPAANVARLAPGYAPEFSLLAFGVALAATLAWCALVWWRAARNRAAIWKSLVLPASGATLGWLLLMTLWLPLLDYGRAFAPQMERVSAIVNGANAGGCVAGYGLNRAQTAALIFHAGLDMTPAARSRACDWAVGDSAARPPPGHWRVAGSAVRPTDRTDKLLILRRARQDR